VLHSKALSSFDKATPFGRRSGATRREMAINNPPLQAAFLEQNSFAD